MKWYECAIFTFLAGVAVLLIALQAALAVLG